MFYCTLDEARIILVSALIAMLSGCGGGSSDSSSGPVTSTLTFPLATANANQINNGFTIYPNVTGTQVVNGTTYNVTGSLTISSSTPTSSTFRVQTALLSTQTTTGTLTVNGQSGPIASTVQVYHTTNYAPLGQSYSGHYLVMQGTPVVPSTGKVGDTGVVGTYNDYTDSAKTTLNGTLKTSFVIEADTANTAIVNIIADEYDTSNTLTSSKQDRWRIDSSGAFTFVSVTINGTTTTGSFNLLYK